MRPYRPERIGTRTGSAPAAWLAVAFGLACSSAPAAECPPLKDICGSKWVQHSEGGGPPQNGVPHGTLPLRVHACQDATAGADIQKALSLMDQHLVPAVQMMDSPLPDYANEGPADPDTRVDIYLLDKGTILTGFRGGDYQDPKTCTPKRVEFGQAAPHKAQGPSPGMLIIQRDLEGGVGGLLFRRILVHEFFHILQYRYRVGCTNWLAEATARAADIFLLPEAADKVPRGHTVDVEFRKFQERRADKGERTLSWMGHAGYDAFAFFYFVLQEHGGGPAIFGSVWRELAQEGNCDRWTERVVQAIGPGTFKRYFRDFSLRNLNLNLQVKDKRYRLYNEGAWKLNSFPVGIPPGFEEGTDRKPRPLLHHAGKAMTLERTGGDVLPLSAQYFHFGPSDGVRYVEFDFRQLRGFDRELGYDYLLRQKKGGRWRLGDKKLGGGRLRLCLDDEQEDFTNLYLILNNSRVDSSVIGHLEIRTFTQCPAAVSGDVVLRYRAEVKGRETDLRGRAAQDMTLGLNLQLKMREFGENDPRLADPEEQWEDAGSSWTLQGSMDGAVAGPDGQKQGAATLRGEGGFDPDAESAPDDANLIGFVVDPDDPKKGWLRLEVRRGIESSTGSGGAFTSLPCKSRSPAPGQKPRNEAEFTVDLGSFTPDQPGYKWWAEAEISDPDERGVRTVTVDCKGRIETDLTPMITHLDHARQVQSLEARGSFRLRQHGTAR